MEGFRYATVLYLNMDHYTICIDPMIQDVCTIITPWGKYKHTRLQMGIMCALNILKEKCQIEGFKFMHTYLDNMLCLSKDHFDEYLEDVAKHLKMLERVNLQNNAMESSFG